MSSLLSLSSIVGLRRCRLSLSWFIFVYFMASDLHWKHNSTDFEKVNTKGRWKKKKRTLTQTCTSTLINGVLCIFQEVSIGPTHRATECKPKRRKNETSKTIDTYVVFILLLLFFFFVVLSFCFSGKLNNIIGKQITFKICAKRKIRKTIAYHKLP